MILKLKILESKHEAIFKNYIEYLHSNYVLKL